MMMVMVMRPALLGSEMGRGLFPHSVRVKINAYIDAVSQTNGMEQLRIEEEMQRHRTSHNMLDKHYANDDSRVLMYEVAKPTDSCSNRLSAPECGLKKSPLSNSLTELCTGMHVACFIPPTHSHSPTPQLHPLPRLQSA